MKILIPLVGIFALVSIAVWFLGFIPTRRVDVFSGQVSAVEYIPVNENTVIRFADGRTIIITGFQSIPGSNLRITTTRRLNGEYRIKQMEAIDGQK